MIKYFLKFFLRNSISETLIYDKSNWIENTSFLIELMGFSVYSNRVNKNFCLDDLFMETSASQYSHNSIEVFNVRSLNSIIQSQQSITTVSSGLLLDTYYRNYLKDSRVYIRISSKLYDCNYLRYYFKPKILSFDSILNLGTASASVNYYHFLFDLIPKVSSKINQLCEYNLITFTGPKSRMLEELISLLGINDITVVMNNKTSYFGKSVCTPSNLAEVGDPDNKTIESILALYSRISGNVKKTRYPKKIYVTRMNASKRRVLNETDLIFEFRKENISVVKLEEYSLIDQYFMFKDAELVIGAHGAGMSNIVFCKEGTKIIEMFPSNYLEPCMFNIASMINLDYKNIVFESSDKNNDFLVKLEQLNQLIEL